jgi:hypothetical protein
MAEVPIQASPAALLAQSVQAAARRSRSPALEAFANQLAEASGQHLAPPVPSAAAPAPAPALSPAPASAPERLLRPGSVLNILV